MGVAVRAMRQYRGFAHSQTPRLRQPFNSQHGELQTLDCRTGYNQESHKLMIVDFEET